MKNREYRTSYRGMRTRQELRASQDEDAKPLIRANRKGGPLKKAGWYDDHIVDETSWKDRRKTKYHIRDVEDLKIKFTLQGSVWDSHYYDYQRKLESMGFFVKVEYLGKHPHKKITLSYRGIKIRIPKNAEYVT